jgi:hypothetical protein
MYQSKPIRAYQPAAVGGRNARRRERAAVSALP